MTRNERKWNRACAFLLGLFLYTLIIAQAAIAQAHATARLMGCQ